MRSLAIRDDRGDRRSAAGGAERVELSITELVHLHDLELVRICIVAGARPDLAREAVQNTWVRAATRLASLRDPTRVRPWLITVAINEVRQLWRKQRAIERQTTELNDARNVPRLMSDSADVDLAAALRQLRPRDRELLSLSYIAGLTSAEIGRILGLTPAGIRTRKARILQRLREELEGGR